MRFTAFASRTRKELIRDPLSMVFGIGFPIILMLLMYLLKQSLKDMPSDVFGIESFAPGMTVFGLSFISLFLAMLMTNDRTTSFLMRLFASPLTGTDYIFGYSLPLLPLAMLQSAVCLAAAMVFGLHFSVGILLALVVILPVAALFISFGILMGCFLNSSQQVGGIGSIIVNVCAWLSGTWFSLDMIGGVFRKLCYALPFAHAVDAVKAAISGNYASILPHLAWVIGYTAVIYILAIYFFRKKMRG